MVIFTWSYERDLHLTDEICSYTYLVIQTEWFIHGKQTLCDTNANILIRESLLVYTE